MEPTFWRIMLKLYLTMGYYNTHFTYKVKKIEATFWRNLFTKSLLNNWLLLVTTAGYYNL